MSSPLAIALYMYYTREGEITREGIKKRVANPGEPTNTNREYKMLTGEPSTVNQHIVRQDGLRDLSYTALFPQHSRQLILLRLFTISRRQNGKFSAPLMGVDLCHRMINTLQNLRSDSFGTHETLHGKGGNPRDVAISFVTGPDAEKNGSIAPPSVADAHSVLTPAGQTTEA